MGFEFRGIDLVRHENKGVAASRSGARSPRRPVEADPRVDDQENEIALVKRVDDLVEDPLLHRVRALGDPAAGIDELEILPHPSTRARGGRA